MSTRFIFIVFSLDLGSTKVKRLYFLKVSLGGWGPKRFKKALFSIDFATFRTSLFETHYAAKRMGVTKGIGSPGDGK